MSSHQYLSPQAAALNYGFISMSDLSLEEFLSAVLEIHALQLHAIMMTTSTLNQCDITITVESFIRMLELSEIGRAAFPHLTQTADRLVTPTPDGKCIQ